MLVTSRGRQRWIIPKGWPHKGRAPHRSAAREAFEEAGVVGKVRRRPVGTFSYRAFVTGVRGTYDQAASAIVTVTVHSQPRRP